VTRRISRRLVLVVVVVALATGACGMLLDADVQQLEAGNCFNLGNLPDEVHRVTRSTCFGFGKAKVLGWVDFSDEPTYPETRWFNGVLANKCNRLLDEEGSSGLVTADPIHLGWLIPTEASWDEGERRAVCYLGAE
jgi:hypothetical protein